jgi:uncharacterized protein
MAPIQNQSAKASPLRRCRPAAVAVLAAALVIIVQPAHALAALRFAAENLVDVLPYVLAGLLITALAVATGATDLIARAFTDREPTMILVASAVGALTPVCGITVLPLIAGLIAAGVPLAPVMAFWLSSPVTDPAMLAITAGLLGWPFAIAKTVAAFAIGLASGAATLMLARTALFAHPLRSRPRPSQACGWQPNGFLLKFWQEPSRRAAFLATGRETGLLMLKWLTVAFLAEYALRQLLPPDIIASYVGGGIGSVALATVVGAPIYLDGYAALPLVRALIDAGMGPGPALAFLIAGGITSAWAAIPVYALTRLPVFSAYLVMAVIGAFLSGLVFGWIM